MSSYVEGPKRPKSTGMGEAIGKQVKPDMRPLYFYWLADGSGSMSDANQGDIHKLNAAIAAAIPILKEEARKNPGVKVFIQTIVFDDEAYWHMGDKAIPLDEIKWDDIKVTPEGFTYMGKAVNLLTDQFTMFDQSPPDRMLPPVAILISDGAATDKADFEAAVERMNKSKWGAGAIKMAVAIGKEASHDELIKFVSGTKLEDGSGQRIPAKDLVFEAKRPEQIIEKIKWASKVALKASSDPFGKPVEVKPVKWDDPSW